MQRFTSLRPALSRRAGACRVPRRALANLAQNILHDTPTPPPHPVTPPLAVNTVNSPLAAHRYGFAPLTSQPFIRFNPSSDPASANSQTMSKFVARLKYTSIPYRATRMRLPPQAVSASSEAIVLPFEDKPRVYWSPGHACSTPNTTLSGAMPFIPERMRSELLEKTILTDIALCDWSIDEPWHPIIVGVHFIETAKTTLHQDGHKFSFVHLYAGLQPSDVPEQDILARFYLESPLDTWAVYDANARDTSYGSVLQEVPGLECSEQNVMICDIEPMVAAVCSI
ncbi:hypothetical protein C8Q78DRAFT_1071820 [Trametes maxima]|nr:hypothetical protein C8Q78DRAFT_1071820 [Trametes maxima]